MPKYKKKWTKKDLVRIEKKLEQLWREYGTLTFRDVDELGMLLNEDITEVLQESFVKLAKSSKIHLDKRVIFDKEHQKDEAGYTPPYVEWWLDYIPF